MSTGSLQEERAALVRERVLAGVAKLLTSGEQLTFSKVAQAAEVPERTVYRHFANMEALLAAVFDWANRQIGFQGELARDQAGAVALVRRVFPGFDQIAPVIRELLIAPAGRLARLANKQERKRAALALVRREVPQLGATERKRLAAIVQLLTLASTWQALRDYWDMDGHEAAEASALAITLLFEAARSRSAAAAR